MNGKAPPLDLFNASPNPYVLVDPELVIAEANEAYLRVTGSRRGDIVGRYIFDAFPSAPSEGGAEHVRVVRESMLRAIQTKRPDLLPVVRFDIAVPAPDGRTRYEERYWSATHTPILDEQGEARFVLQHTVDITELHRLRQQEKRRQEIEGADAMLEGDVLRRAEQVQATNIQLEANLQRLTNLFNLAPSFIAMVRGPEHVFELANDSYLKLVQHRNIVGKTVREALPEVEGQGFFELLDEVYDTGRAVVQRAAPVDLREPQSGQFQRHYLDFVFQPIETSESAVSGIFVEGHDVTEQVTAREAQGKLIEELEAAKDRLSRSLSTGRVGVFEWDVDSDVLSVSGPIAAHFGVARADAEGGLPLVSFMQGIHEEDRERVAAAVQRTVETGEPYEEEYRLLGAGRAMRSVIARGHIEPGAKGQRRFIGVLIDVTEQKEAERAVREAGQRLRLALEASRMGDWSWDPVSDRVELSERAAEIFGAPSCSTTWTLLQQQVHPADRKSALETMRRSVRLGSSYAVEYRVQHGFGSERWVVSRGRGNHDEQGRLTAVFGILEDITARKKAEEAQTILLHEVDHRAKNVLAVVEALVKMTPFRNRDDYIAVLSGRIHALARAHSLLSSNRWLGASLADLVRQELVPYASEDELFTVEGPQIEIRPQGTQPLSLILHELATNAAKHGAISQPNGRIHVRWSVKRGAEVELEWRELGCRRAGKAGAAGFGSRLIAGAAKQLQAELEQEWLPDGLRIVLALPSEVAIPAAGAAESPRPAARQDGILPAGLRVLIVEDEALIAMDLEEALAQAGADVVGTAYSLEDALNRVRTDTPDIAVVDMNLGGDSALPLVELLRSMNKPFVVATGFEQPDLQHDWILRKPVAQDVLVGAINRAVTGVE